MSKKKKRDIAQELREDLETLKAAKNISGKEKQMNEHDLLQSSAEYYDKIVKSLVGKRIMGVGLPDAGEPFDEILLVLEDGSGVLLSASSSDGSGSLAWGVNVPGANDITIHNDPTRKS